MSAARHTIALLPAGDRFEDFFDKIGVTLESFAQHQTGGWLFNYVDALAHAGHDTVIVVMSAHVTSPARLRHEPTGCRISVLPTPWVHRKLRAARWRYAPQSSLLKSLEGYVATPPRSLARELRELGCTVILCQEYESPRFDVCVLLGRLLGTPVFATYQGARNGHSRIESLVRRPSVRRTAGLIIGSADERGRVRRRYHLPEHSVFAIPNPLDVQRWRPQDREAARRALSLQPDRRIVVWHGRVQIERKGLDVLLAAWRQVCAVRADHLPLLLLVGSGRDAPELQYRLRDLADGTVRWVPEYVQDRERLRRYLSAADVAVLSSRHEGFPVAALEAMACALPVVAADVSGVRELLQAAPDCTAGMIVPPGDVDALAHSLGRLVDDEKLSRELGTSARSAAERFSIEQVGAQLADALTPRGRRRA